MFSNLIKSFFGIKNPEIQKSPRITILPFSSDKDTYNQVDLYMFLSQNHQFGNDISLIDSTVDCMTKKGYTVTTHRGGVYGLHLPNDAPPTVASFMFPHTEGDFMIADPFDRFKEDCKKCELMCYYEKSEIQKVFE